MSSFDPQKKDSSGESAPLLQREQQVYAAGASPQPSAADNYNGVGKSIPNHAVNPPQQTYGSYGNPGIPTNSPYAANNVVAAGSSYFLSPTGYPIQPPPQDQQSPIIFHSPNQARGMLPQPPFFYPYPPPQEGGALPQYQYPMYPVQQQYQQQRVGSNEGTQPIDTAPRAPTNSGSLPPLNDIFNAPGEKESQPSEYGSMNTSPKIYNAPIRRLPPSGRTATQSNDSKRLPKSTNSAPKDHRRVHSDSPLRSNRAHRRANTDEALPPRGHGAGHNRSRTLSGGNPLPRSRHRRADSSSSYHSMGGGSYTAGSIADSSQVSMRSNIAKSTLFAGVDEQGRPLLYKPYEAIRLVMIPDHEKQEKNSRGGRRNYSDYHDDDTAEEEDHLPLTIGHLYADEPDNMEDYYEDYHRVSDELEQGITPQWESLDTHPLGKNKNKGGEGYLTQKDRQELLPPTNYVVAVSDDIYRRMFSEVADSQRMPCGLFFCGHHEDVDYPSVWIPTTLVVILFGTLSYLSYLTEG